MSQLGAYIQQTAQRGGSLLIPAFALGRTQEVLAAVNLLKKENRIPDLPVVVVGMGNKITKKYEEYSSVLAESDEDILGKYHEIRGFPSVKEILSQSSIIIATNGMLASDTPSAQFAQYMLEDERHTILFPGYVGEEADGFKLLNHSGPITINNTQVYKRCTVGRVDFSAHATANDIVGMIKQIKPRQVLFVHGDKTAVTALADKTASAGYRAYAPCKEGERILLHLDSRPVACRSSAQQTVLLITVGTSLLNNYQRSQGRNTCVGASPVRPSAKKLLDFLKMRPTRRSAELNTIFSCADLMRQLQRMHAVLLVSEKEDGRLCGEVIAQYLRQHAGIRSVETEVITGLCEDVNRFRAEGLRRFVLRLIELVKAYQDAVIVATGGYKATTAYATLIGTLFNKPVLYVHEDFKSPDPVIRMPRFPLAFDLSAYAAYAEILDRIISQQDDRRTDAILRGNLPPALAELFTWDQATGRFRLNILGEVMRRMFAEWEREYTRKKRECAFAVHIPGLLPDPVAGEQPTVASIRDERVKWWFTLLLKLRYVRGIGVHKYAGVRPTEAPPVPSDSSAVPGTPAALQFVRRRHGTVDCRLLWGDRVAAVHIHVVPGFEEDCKTVIINTIPQTV